MALTVVHCGQAGLLGSYESSVLDNNEVPVPNTDENVDWWLSAAEDDFDRVFNILANLQRKGVKWVGWLFDLIVKETDRL